MQSKRIKAIRKYLNKDERLSQDLIKITKLYKQKPNHYALSTFLSIELSPCAAFKFMILLQTLIYQQALNNQLCLNLLNLMKWQKDEQLNAIFPQKYLNTYKLFLQKLCHLNLQKQFDAQQKEAIIYQMINLILMAQPLSQMIYQFGRYFSQKYKFIIDFNIILAKDLRSLYEVINSQLKFNCERFSTEIQLVNESLYPIYYNNYFHKIVSKYHPKFMILDLPQTPKKHNNKSNDLTKGSTADMDLSSLQRNSSLLLYLQKKIVEIDDKEYLVRQFNAQQEKQSPNLQRNIEYKLSL